MLAVYGPLHAEYAARVVEFVDVQRTMAGIRRTGNCSTSQFRGGCRNHGTTGDSWGLLAGYREVAMKSCDEWGLHESADEDDIGREYHVELIRAVDADSLID